MDTISLINNRSRNFGSSKFTRVPFSKSQGGNVCTKICIFAYYSLQELFLGIWSNCLIRWWKCLHFHLSKSLIISERKWIEKACANSILLDWLSSWLVKFMCLLILCGGSKKTDDLKAHTWLHFSSLQGKRWTKCSISSHVAENEKLYHGWLHHHFDQWEIYT